LSSLLMRGLWLAMPRAKRICHHSIPISAAVCIPRTVAKRTGGPAGHPPKVVGRRSRRHPLLGHSPWARAAGAARPLVAIALHLRLRACWLQPICRRPQRPVWQRKSAFSRGRARRLRQGGSRPQAPCWRGLQPAYTRSFVGSSWCWRPTAVLTGARANAAGCPRGAGPSRACAVLTMRNPKRGRPPAPMPGAGSG